jgi:hypothetical protein
VVALEAAPGLLVDCRVTDAKRAYGRLLLELEPLAGSGRAWVNQSSVLAQPLEGSHVVNTCS